MAPVTPAPASTSVSAAVASTVLSANASRKPTEFRPIASKVVVNRSMKLWTVIARAMIRRGAVSSETP